MPYFINMCVQALEGDLSQEDQDDEDLCLVCWEQLQEVIFYNCMHMVRPLSYQMPQTPGIRHPVLPPAILPATYPGDVPWPPCLVYALLSASPGRKVGSGCTATERSKLDMVGRKLPLS